MLLADPSAQRQHKSISFARRPSERHISQHTGIFFPANDRCQNMLPGLTHDVGENRTQLEIGILKHFVQSIDQPGAFLREGGARAGQIAQLPLRSRGNEARFEQAKLQEFSDPFRIFLVRFQEVKLFCNQHG